MLKLSIDECISPRIAAHLCDNNKAIAEHTRDNGLSGKPDHIVLAQAIRRDQVIVTENGPDFLGLIGNEELHPGLIIIPNVPRIQSQQLIEIAINHIVICAKAENETPNNFMINRVVEVSQKGDIGLYHLPEIERTERVVRLIHVRK